MNIDDKNLFRDKLKEAFDKLYDETSVVRPKPIELRSAAEFTKFMGTLPQYNDQTSEEEFQAQMAVADVIHKVLNRRADDDTNV